MLQWSVLCTYYNQFLTEQATEWGAWGEWSECTKTCDDHGTQNRERHCMNGNSCEGINFETRNCNEDIPCARETLTATYM